MFMESIIKKLMDQCKEFEIFTSKEIEYKFTTFEAS